MTPTSDTLYSKEMHLTPFRFDKRVAAVFTDMIKRSVPGYAEVIANIQQIASQFTQVDSHCYDLGCSLGAASLAMSRGNQQSGVEIIAVDNSFEMLEQSKHNIESFVHKTPISLVQSDIRQLNISNASMVVLNYTLQFIPLEQRVAVLENIYNGLQPGGILVLSEKVVFSNPAVNQLMIDLHHQFKRDHGYSELEISQKRSALENVLVPELIETHLSRLTEIGFKHVDCFQQQLNFASIVAIKSRSNHVQTIATQ